MGNSERERSSGSPGLTSHCCPCFSCSPGASGTWGLEAHNKDNKYKTTHTHRGRQCPSTSSTTKTGIHIHAWIHALYELILTQRTHPPKKPISRKCRRKNQSVYELNSWSHIKYSWSDCTHTCRVNASSADKEKAAAF